MARVCWMLVRKKRFLARRCMFFVLLLYCLGMIFALTSQPDVFLSVYRHANRINNVTLEYFDRRHTPHHHRCVTFGQSVNDGRRLGNQLFNFASILYVAAMTNRQPAIVNKYATGLEEVFDLHQVKHADDLCPCRDFTEDKALTFDTRIEEFVFTVPDNETIRMNGFYQSWKYTQTIEKDLRKHFVFKHHIRQSAARFLADNIPLNWINSFVRIGIHVRRGDIMVPDKLLFGYTVPNSTYFTRAMQLLADFYGPRIQFVVVSDDIAWCKQRFPLILAEILGESSDYNYDGNSTSWNSTMKPKSTRSTKHLGLHINVTYSTARSAGEDLALLASCDHTIMSTGTYGWWAAWLAKGTTVYYANWPRNGSALLSIFKRNDFFPPSWIGLVD